MSRFMNSNINRLAILLTFLVSIDTRSDETSREALIREAIKSNGFAYSRDLYVELDHDLAPQGKVFFESTHVSLNGEIACATCHSHEMASTDGIPNAAGIRGTGEGVERLLSGAKIVPRNTLALWGVGSKGMNTLFWDGKLSFADGKTISQFGSVAPSQDPLITAVHLPAVEIRETLDEDAFILRNKNEKAQSADVIYEPSVENLRHHETRAMHALADKRGISLDELSFIDIASSIAAFIRDEFRIRDTKLEQYVAGTGKLSESELRGAEIFYGKGGCSLCHSGSNFTDQSFHTVSFPQLGFGKNGFGIDYGRYNATFNPEDLYKFRTPSLYNVARTAPYGHSGSVTTLEDAIIAHYDPLALVDIDGYDNLQRHQFGLVLAKSDTLGIVNYLARDEVMALVDFLEALSF